MTKWSFIFLPDKEKGKEDAKLRMRIRWDGNIIAFSVGYRIDVSKWNPETQRCRINSTHGKKKVPASIINREISRYEMAAESLFSRYAQSGIIPDKAAVRRDFLLEARGIVTAKDAGSIDECFREFIRTESARRSWSDNTVDMLRHSVNHLIRFRPGLTFAGINAETMKDLAFYLTGRMNLKNTSTERIFTSIRWFLGWAADKGYLASRDFELFRPKLKKAERKVVFLEWDELMRMYGYHFGKGQETLETVRDVFCFCCFTSLRYSDVKNLKRSDVYQDRIEVTTIKTERAVTIELNSFAKAILDKYKAIPLKGDAALPVPANTLMNIRIKKVGQLCGIDTPTTVTSFIGSRRIEEVKPKYELIGTHTGRRTFVCNALMLGIAPDIVMEWTGHKDYASMKPYVGIADSARSKAMGLFDKKASPLPESGTKKGTV